jgi:hypothetical protein
MGNEVIVVAGATHRAGLLDDYQRQLEQASVPFHLEMVEPMPAGPNSMTMRRKAEFVRAMAEKFRDYKTIYITDAWDVLFFGTLEDLISKNPKKPTFSAERNAYPESDIEGIGNTPWKYCNAGCVVGSPVDLLLWSALVRHLGINLDILDQAWLNRHLNMTDLDTETNLFYTVASENEALELKGGRPWNSVCDTYPNFLHFSGGRNADQWRTI